MKIITDNSIIVAIAQSVEIVDNGIFVPEQNVIYAVQGLTIHDVPVIPEGVKPQTHKYENGEFVVNNNYIVYKTPEQEIIELKIKLGELPPVSNPQSLQDYQQNKIYELSVACELEILAGFYSSARGTQEWFTNSRDDQNHVIGQATLATLNPSFVPEWKSADENICTPFTKEQITQLATDGAEFMTERIKTFETLRNQVVAMTTIEEVNEVIWVKRVWS